VRQINGSITILSVQMKLRDYSTLY